MSDKSQSFYETKYSNTKHRNPVMGGTTNKGFPQTTNQEIHSK